MVEESDYDSMLIWKEALGNLDRYTEGDEKFGTIFTNDSLQWA